MTLVSKKGNSTVSKQLHLEIIGIVKNHDGYIDIEHQMSTQSSDN